MKTNLHLIAPVLLSLTTSLIVLATYHYIQSSESSLRSQYYRSEVATLESPHGIRKAIHKGNNSFILVDVRSAKEYGQEHIVGALSVPVYKNPDTAAYNEEDRIVSEFKKIQEKYPDRKVIIYCYSSSCMSGRKVGKMLAENDIFVKELGVGWNEWRYDWNMWNYPHEWETTVVEDYVVSGTTPGVYQGVKALPEGCSANRDLGC